MLNDQDNAIGDLLAGRGIRYEYLDTDRAFLDDVDKKAQEIYKKDRQCRSFEHVKACVRKAEYQEHGLHNYLNQFLPGSHNVEDPQDHNSFCFDLIINGRRSEIKSQKPTPYFEFDSSTHEGQMVSHWRLYDLIIGCYLNHIHKIIIPRQLISSAAMDQHLGLYIDSAKPQCYRYLRKAAYGSGYARELNPMHRCITHVDQLILV